jgi:hypothetical protein
MKICLLEAKFIHSDGQTDRRDEDNSRFSQFCQLALQTQDGQRTYKVELVLNVMAHRCAWEGDLRGNRRMVWVPS